MILHCFQVFPFFTSVFFNFNIFQHVKRGNNLFFISILTKCAILCFIVKTKKLNIQVSLLLLSFI